MKCAVCGELTPILRRDVDGDLLCIDCDVSIAHYAGLPDDQWATYIGAVASSARTEGAS